VLAFQTRKKRTDVRFPLSLNGDYFGVVVVGSLPLDFLEVDFLEEDFLEEDFLEEDFLEDLLDFFSLFGASAEGEPDGAGACAATVKVNAAKIMATAAEIRRFIVYFLSYMGAGTARHLTSYR